MTVPIIEPQVTTAPTEPVVRTAVASQRAIAPATYVTTTTPVTYTEPNAAQPYAVTEAYNPPIMRLSNEATQLHELVTRPDVSTAVNFQGSERIQVVLMGQREEFFVDTPANRQTISIRPKTAQSHSNMTVVTNRDIYHFNVRAISQRGSDAAPTYGVVVEDREALENAKRNSLGNLENLNFSYTFRGSNDLRPMRMFDDGKHTYFQFPPHTKYPAIFAVEEDGSESIINHHVKGNYLVVQSLHRQFTLRNGPTTTCIYNKAYPSPTFGDEAPALEGTGA